MKLSEFLKNARDSIVKKVRYNEKFKRVGYSEYTQWDTCVSFDEMEVVDFDELMLKIEEFENEFKEKKNGTT